MTFVRYVAIQLLAYGVDMGLFLLVLHFGFLGPVAANVIAKLAAGFFAFAAHRHFTFAVAGDGLIKRQGIRYLLLLAANVPVASALLAVILIWIPVPAIAKFLSDIIGVLLTYFLSKHFIFNTNAGPSDRSVPDSKT